MRNPRSLLFLKDPPRFC